MAHIALPRLLLRGDAVGAAAAAAVENGVETAAQELRQPDRPQLQAQGTERAVAATQKALMAVMTNVAVAQPLSLTEIVLVIMSMIVTVIVTVQAVTLIEIGGAMLTQPTAHTATRAQGAMVAADPAAITIATAIGGGTMIAAHMAAAMAAAVELMGTAADVGALQGCLRDPYQR